MHETVKSCFSRRMASAWLRTTGVAMAGPAKPAHQEEVNAAQHMPH
jgi:hypothetical protein